tara:strand:- start:149 stop:382 length:234 start_codon:yes stop_codon:yes gene_type:complete
MAFKMKGSSLYGNLKKNKPVVDLKKQSGFGPRAAKGKDDQSKELAKSRYEMGKYKNDPTKKQEDRPGPKWENADEVD